MGDAASLNPRQIWANPTATNDNPFASCSPFVIPRDGRLRSFASPAFALKSDFESQVWNSTDASPLPVLGFVHLNPSQTLTVTQNAVFEPICSGQPTDVSHISAVLNTREPFYSSTAPQLYAIGCVTVLSYLLVIMLFITPRTFYVGGPGGGANILGRHGMISGSYSGNSSVVGVGGRPWLQKLATTLVAISLTIASVDSFTVARRQYIYGYEDAGALTEEVIGGLEIRIVRVISGTFLWLAQVQTLIRLFPRHKEKVMIKWAGFALIVLDTIFAILDAFLVESNTVLIPVVFFVLDISKPNVAGWGSYIRWVGSAAASVVVWEWVERIEALERDENKDGILGREVFDGDEMLEVTPSEEVGGWPRRPSNGHDRGGGTGTSSGWGGIIGLGHSPLRTRVGFARGKRGRRTGDQNESDNAPNGTNHQTAAGPTPPPNVATPISRGDTMSAGSTVYNVRYHPVSSPTPPAVMPQTEERENGLKELPVISESAGNWEGHGIPAQQTDPLAPAIHADRGWRSLLRPFKSKRASLPREVAFAQAEEGQSPPMEGLDSSNGSNNQGARPQVDNRYPLNQGTRPATGRRDDASLPVTVIPAGRQGQQTWSPRWFDDSNILDPWRRHQHQPPHSDLPVRVIPSRTRTAAPWTGPNGETEFGNNDYEMRYDPDAAALVGPDDVLSADVERDAPINQSFSDDTADEFEEPSASTEHRQQEAPRYPTGQQRAREHMAGDSSGPQDPSR
ncbi:hypothetical protein PHISP_00529 [Aspergillus sp. HF37]|nr:hypothetical protein PHISP_00529 [Aspergillus sp. HF37]